MQRAATLSPDGVYRYDLTRRWWQAGPTVLWIMLNPSTADDEVDDQTMTRVLGFSAAHKFAEAVVVNLFALRSKNPHDLLDCPDPVGPGNDQFILDHAARTAASGGRILCAWGVHGGYLNRGPKVTQALTNLGYPLWCLGQTKVGGHPRHPSRLSSRQPIEVYR